MSASRSLPISTAMPAKASQRWSAMSSVRGVLSSTSTALPSLCEDLRAFQRRASLVIGEHAALDWEQVGGGLDQGIRARQRREEKIRHLRRAVLDHLRREPLGRIRV